MLGHANRVVLVRIDRANCIDCLDPKTQNHNIDFSLIYSNGSLSIYIYIFYKQSNPYINITNQDTYESVLGAVK